MLNPRCLTLQSRGQTPASRCLPLISNVRPHASRMHSVGMVSTGSKQCVGGFARRTKAGLPRAVRPASLAASAPAVVVEALAGRSGFRIEAQAGRCFIGKASPHQAACLLLVSNRGCAEGQSQGSFFALQWCFSVVLRCGAAQSIAGRAGTRCFAARAGGFGLLAGGVTQRTMRAGLVLFGARSNPSIERTSPGKPGAASHLKR